jgi:hypothetical protein
VEQVLHFTAPRGGQIGWKYVYNGNFNSHRAR